MPRRLRALDPLVIFLVLGAGLVGLHVWTRTPEVEISDRRIVVTDADVSWILEAFQKRRFRPPTRAELGGLVDRHVKDEILYREAVALGFDREDPALRRRLATKLEYLAKDVGAAAEPTEAELEAWLDAHPTRYAVHPRRSFQQVYVSTDRRGAQAESDARAMLGTLRAHPDGSLDEIGDPLLLEIEQPPSTADAVKRQFGAEFADALFALEVGPWSGPVRSGFGLHLVRVREEEAGSSPPLEAVRARVRDDLLQQRKEAALEAYLGALLEKYDVQIRSSLLVGEEPTR